MSGPSAAYNLAMVLTGSPRLAASAVMRAVAAMDGERMAWDELVNRTIRAAIDILSSNQRGAFNPDGAAPVSDAHAAVPWQKRGNCRNSASARHHRN